MRKVIRIKGVRVEIVYTGNVVVYANGYKVYAERGMEQKRYDGVLRQLFGKEWREALRRIQTEVRRMEREAPRAAFFRTRKLDEWVS